MDYNHCEPNKIVVVPGRNLGETLSFKGEFRSFHDPSSDSSIKLRGSTNKSIIRDGSVKISKQSESYSH